MTSRKRKKKQRREEEKQVLPGIELGTSCTRYHYDTMQLETHCEDVDNILLTAFHFRQRTLYKVDRAPLRWLDTVFQGQYLPSLSIYYVAINKVLEKLPPQLY